MDKRLNISTHSEFEKKYGYCRVVKVGNTVYISGTVGVNYEIGDCPKDPVDQLHQIIKNITPSLEKAGASLKDIVQITTYMTSAEVFEQIGPALASIFGDIQPTNTALVVNFPLPHVKLEISGIAVIGCGDDS